jgi:hypothetical protein
VASIFLFYFKELGVDGGIPGDAGSVIFLTDVRDRVACV